MANMVSYQDTRENFELTIPDRFNFTGDVMLKRATETPDKLALIAIEPDGTTINRYTFGDLGDMANRTAHLLRANGIGMGDKAVSYTHLTLPTKA